MANKQNIRKALKEISHLSDEMNYGMDMDNAMDGSGECGGIIFNGWCNWFNRELTAVLSSNQVTLSQVMEVADTWAKRELENGPKKIFIPMYSRRKGLYKVVDYCDTKWGNVANSIHNMIHANEYE